MATVFLAWLFIVARLLVAEPRQRHPMARPQRRMTHQLKRPAKSQRLRMWGTSGVPVDRPPGGIARPLRSWRLVEAFLIGALAAAPYWWVGRWFSSTNRPTHVGAGDGVRSRVLLSAVAFELVEEATEMADGAGPAFIGLFAGGGTFTIGDARLTIQGPVSVRTYVAPRLTPPARRSSSVRCSMGSRSRQCSG